MSVVQEIILSICIPTYRRGAYLARDVMGWLASDRQDFEIIISDNASGDGSFEILNKIKDPRVRVIGNKINIGGFENGFKTFLAARGKYAMILMDKDTLTFEHIDDVLDTMGQLDVACGLIEPNTSQSSAYKTTKKENEILFKYGLCYAHPSGHFYRTKYIKEGRILEQLRNLPENTRPFSTDFQISLFARCGSYARLKIPFVKLISPPFPGTTKSVTYTNSPNAYFMPQAHFNVLYNYINLLHQLKQNFLWRMLTIFRQAGLLFAFSTSTYMYMLAQNNICEWYGLSPEFRSAEMRRPLIFEYYLRIFGAKGLAFPDKFALLFGGLCCLPFAIRFKYRTLRATAQ